MPEFTIPITASQYVRENMPWAEAVAVGIQRELADLTTLAELYNEDIPVSKIPEVLKLYGAEPLATDIMTDDFLRRLHARAPQIVHQRLTVASHRLFAEALDSSYDYRFVSPTLTIYITPASRQTFNTVQQEYITAAYKWLSPINVEVVVEIRQAFDIAPKVAMGARFRVTYR